MATQHVISAEIRLATEKYLKSLAEIEARNGQSIDGVVKGSGRAGDAVERDMGRGSKAMDGLGGAAGRLAASLAGAFTFRELVTAPGVSLPTLMLANWARSPLQAPC